MSRPEQAFRLTGAHIALCDLLKLAGVAGSAGQGKALVAAGAVSVDGRPEARKTAKIRAGQLVECLGTRIRVLAAASPRDGPYPAGRGTRHT